MCEWRPFLKDSRTTQPNKQKQAQRAGRASGLLRQGDSSFGYRLHGRKGYLACLRKYGKPPGAFHLPKSATQIRETSVQYGAENETQRDELT